MNFTRKIIFLLFTFSTFSNAICQESTTIFPIPSSGNSMHYEDIWNLTIILNPPPTSAYYFIEIEIKDEPGSSLWKAKTYTFKIPSSPYTILPTALALLEPININFAEAGWHEKMTRGGGLFPPGNYRITYRLIQTTEGCTTAGKLLETVSIYKKITSLFPPSLLFPFNKDSLDVETPVFAWSPVMPVQPSGITYSVKVAEISGNQTAEQALINNRSYLYYDAGESLSIPYPPANMPLRKGSNYAWQVIAQTPTGILSFSEAWTFVIKPDIEIDTIPTDQKVFLSIKSSPAGPLYLVNGNYLFIRYDENYADADGGLLYVLSSSENHENILTGKIFPLSEQKGLNTYALDIRSLKEGNYVFSIEDEKGNKGYITFKRGILSGNRK